jgi:flagellar basal-body rod protein FlgB
MVVYKGGGQTAGHLPPVAAQSRRWHAGCWRNDDEGLTRVDGMFQGIFQSTTIPALEQVVNFAQARHTVLAGNIANLGTPGYHARDLSVEDFQTRLKEAIEAAHQPPAPPSLGDPDRSRPNRLADVAKSPTSILFHDQSNDAAEIQVTEMVKNQLQHNMALAIMTSQFRLLQTAISERV